MPAHGEGIWRHARARRKKLPSCYGGVAEVAREERRREPPEKVSRGGTSRRYRRKARPGARRWGSQWTGMTGQSLRLGRLGLSLIANPELEFRVSVLE